jgi:hypothetical protein
MASVVKSYVSGYCPLRGLNVSAKGTLESWRSFDHGFGHQKLFDASPVYDLSFSPTIRSAVCVIWARDCYSKNLDDDLYLFFHTGRMTENLSHNLGPLTRALHGLDMELQGLLFEVKIMCGSVHLIKSLTSSISSIQKMLDWLNRDTYLR